MNRTFITKLTILIGAVTTAFVLTVYRPSPRGLIPFGVGQAEVRAAPGTPASKAKANYDLTALKVFNQTLVKIRDNYVDPTRIDAKGMLRAALDSVQRNIAEVLVEPHPDKNEVLVQVNDKTQTFPTTDVDSVWKLSSRLKEIFRFIQANMNPGSDPAQIEYAAVNGMLSTLDPHSVLLDPEAAREMDITTSGKFGGIGIVIGMYKKRLTVMRLLEGDTPAIKAGLKTGDHIVKIGDDTTDNLTLNEAMNRLRGDPDTKVTVAVERTGTAGVTPYEITRDIIHVSSVKGQFLSGGVGYLKIDQFSQDTAGDLKRTMEGLKKQGAKAWVLDLRGNPGGLLDQAVKVADVFVDSGTIVTTVGYAGKQRDEKRASGPNTDKAPLAVLVSSGSASASEIVAGALKNLDRGIIIGQTTFGKGSVQVLLEMDDGSKLKLTIAQYLIPGDVSIQSVGITPDIELDRVFVPDKIAGYKDFVRLIPALSRFREAEYDAHLTSKNAREGDKPAETVRFLYEDPRKALAQNGSGAAAPPGASSDPKPGNRPDVDDPDDEGDDEEAPADRDKFVEDYEIQFARDLVASLTSGKRHDLLRDAKAYVQKRREAEEQKISAALGKIGIDWTTGPKAPGAKLAATITTDKQQNKMNGGDTIAITGTVTNSGTAPAYRVYAKAKTDDYGFENTELVFGKIDPGASRTFTAYVRVPKDADSRMDMLDFQFSEENGVKVDVQPLKVAIEGLARPQYAYTYQLIDDVGNGDGLLQPGESMRLHVTVKNVGPGKGTDTTGMLRSASGDGIVVNKGRFEIGKIEPNESRTIDFTFDVKKDYGSSRDVEVGPDGSKMAVVELTVFDADLREGVNEKLRFPIHAADAGPRPASGMVKVSKKDIDVRAGAAEDAATVGVAKKGAVLKLTGREGTWARVELEAGRPGFIPESAVSPASGAPTAGAFTPSWQVTPPTLAVNPPSIETNGDHWTLQGSAIDDNHLEDVFILVSNRESKIDARKVFYASNRGRKNGKKLDFSTSIPVWPGNNLITIVARENNEVRTTESIWVFRHDSAHPPTAAVK